MSAKAITEARRKTLQRIQSLQRLGAKIPAELIGFLSKVEPFEAMLDLSVYALCNCADVKQQLLASRSLAERNTLFGDYLEAQLDELQVMRKLKGNLGEEDISSN